MKEGAPSQAKEVEPLPLIPLYGKKLRQLGKWGLAFGVGAGLVFDGLTWVITGEGSLVRIILILIVCAGSASTVGIGFLVDALVRRKVGRIQIREKQ